MLIIKKIQCESIKARLAVFCWSAGKFTSAAEANNKKFIIENGPFIYEVAC